jgi:hypothetical protein
MNLFHWKNPAIGSAHGKRQVKLERKRWKDSAKALKKLIKIKFVFSKQDD